MADHVLLSRFAPDREDCRRGQDNSTPAASLTARVGLATGFAYEEWNPHTRWTYANDVEADVDPHLAVIVSALVTSCHGEKPPTAAPSLAAPSTHRVADVSVTSDQALYTQSPFQFGTTRWPERRPFILIGTLETARSAASSLGANIDDFRLDFGTATSFHAKLNAAIASLGANDTAGACGSLQISSMPPTRTLRNSLRPNSRRSSSAEREKSAVWSAVEFRSAGSTVYGLTIFIAAAPPSIAFVGLESRILTAIVDGVVRLQRWTVNLRVCVKSVAKLPGTEPAPRARRSRRLESSAYRRS